MTRIFGVMAFAAGLTLASGAHAQTTTTTTGDSITTRTEGAGGVEIHSSSNSSTASHTSSSGGSSGGHVTVSGPTTPSTPPPISASGPDWNFSIGGSDSATGDAHSDDDFGGADSPVNQKFDAMPPMMGPVARIVLYENADHRGHRIGITHDEPNLDARHFNGVASAARVQGGAWELCSAPNYGGTCHRVDADTDLDAAGYGDSVQSVRMVQ